MDFDYCIKDKEISFWYANGSSLMSGDEFHSFHEILYIFRAEGSFLSEKEKAQLSPDTLILIPKETYHNFIFAKDSDYVRCRIWFDDIAHFGDVVRECMSGIRVISEVGETLAKLFSELSEISKIDLPNIEKRLLLRSSVLRILFEIKNSRPGNPNMQIQNELVRNAAAIIEKSYRDDISVPKIAARLFVSPSQLSHTFKKELNISIYKYITLKRLICVQKLIKSGIKASDAARQCGFCDYSSFYRVYKNHYGVPPFRTK